ncbi:MAG: hypothetical protein ABFD10_19155 [Prolixibacteraceae bacterium]
MKKFYVVLLFFAPALVVAQDSKEENREYRAGDVFIGFTSGIDYHANAF